MNTARAKSAFQKTLVVHLETDMYKTLRQISHDEDISMSQLAREGIEKIIKKHKKNIDAKV